MNLSKCQRPSARGGSGERRLDLRPPITDWLVWFWWSVAFTLGVSSAALDRSWPRFILLIAAASGFNLGSWRVIRAAERVQISIKFLYVVHAIQAPLVLLILTLFVPAAGRAEAPFSYMIESPFATAVGLITIPVGILITIVAKRALVPARGNELTFADVLQSPGKEFHLYLILAGLVYAGFAYAIEEKSGKSGYVLRILFNSTGFMAVFAGYYLKRFRFSTVVWFCAMGFYVVYSAATGSRGVAVVYGALFFLGWLWSHPDRKTRTRLAIVIGTPVFATVIIYSAIIEQTRTVLGRGGIDMLREFDIGDYLSVSKAAVSQYNQEAVSGSGSGLIGSGVERLVQWCNATVPPMTPMMVPYRGFDDIWLEVGGSLKIGAVNPNAIYWTNLFSNSYGFLSNESTSVDFGLVADGWSRAGFIGALAYGVAASMFVMSAESIVWRLFRNRRSIIIVLLAVLVHQCVIDFTRTGAVAVVRNTILYLLFVGIAFLFASTVYHALGLRTLGDTATGRRGRPAA